MNRKERRRLETITRHACELAERLEIPVAITFRDDESRRIIESVIADAMPGADIEMLSRPTHH